ncbi:ureidoglycolate lyase [Usitatibacter palustris]|uniref:Ureidoglycolate hydrolase n=1 Tax=Usitatibacter palustris TaxID=2732487 RepID=A0A6M4H1F0_9PROT|nr:ureidoglycolate lyase [Usitatibacter palustris]QJR13319.1 hypothetical protein DSM104440_00102 [Usitatibacter palustris]
MDGDILASFPQTLRRVEVPLVRATNESLKGYGKLVDDPKNFAVEIVPWPLKGWRKLDPGTGNQGGTVTGTFDFWWEGDVLMGRNDAVDHTDEEDEYLIGWSCDPRAARRDNPSPDHSRVLLWHANYHPDGGQLFFPTDGGAFVSPLALPGEDVKPEDFVSFYVEGGKGLYIHPNIWHEAVFPLATPARFHDEQGKVHGRVSCNFAEEFGLLLDVALRKPD